MRMKTYKLIKDAQNSPLKKLNEGQNLKNPDKYVFQGVFTACSTPDHKIINRNGRIYQEREMLRHLGYLRDMIKENNGRILGELDHPEGRFDVSMKEASHMITDLWYDESTHCVMGRLEVLDTPNGQTLKHLIDAGFPLYVSSRAAGDVNEKTKEVEIAQIFTYDVVCTPGFKEARLERVNESILTDKDLKYINESISSSKKINIDSIDVPAKKINEAAVASFNKTTIKDVMKPLFEDEDVSETKDEKKEEKKNDEEPLNDVANFFPTMSGNTDVNEDDEAGDSEDKDDNKDDNKDDSDDSDNSDDEKDDDEDSEDSDDSDDKEELTDEEKEENRKLIIDIKGYDKDGDIMGDDEDSDKSSDIVDIKAESDEDDENSDEEDSDEDADKNSDEETDEETENEDTESDEAEELREKQKKLKKQTDADLSEIDSLLDSVQKAESVKESIIRRYPFTISLSESNFAKFASLRPKFKKRCADFIEEHSIFDVQAINELWETPLREDKKMQQNWLKLASQSDIDLYVSAPVDVQNAIEESAKYVVLETAEDVDLFWQRTGLRQANAQRIMNEQKIENYKQNITKSSKNEEELNSLGYSMDFIKMTEDYFNMK